MSLFDEGKRIDDLLREERNQWQLRVREVEKRMYEVEEQLKIAASFGDLSENNEYTTAADEKQRCIKEKSELEIKISQFDSSFQGYATTERTSEYVKVGSVVRLAFPEAGKQFVVKVVPHKADAPRKGAISSASPLGRALLNKKSGERTMVVTERRKWDCVVEEVY